MTTVVRSGPAPLSRVWTPRGVIAEDLQGEDLGDVLEMHSDAFAWWVLPKGEGYGERELRGAAESMGLDSLVVKDLLAQDGRAKFEEVGPARIITTNTVALDRERTELRTHPMSVVVTERILICLVDPTPDFRPNDLFTAHADALTTGGTDAALRELMIAVVNTYENVVEWMEESSDALAAALFALEPLSRADQLQAFRLRTVLNQLRRVTDPMRTVLTDAAANPPVPAGKKAGGGDPGPAPLDHDRGAPHPGRERRRRAPRLPAGGRPDQPVALRRAGQRHDEAAVRLGRDHRRPDLDQRLRRHERRLPAGEHPRGLLGRPGGHGRRRGGPVRRLPRQALGLSAVTGARRATSLGGMSDRTRENLMAHGPGTPDTLLPPDPAGPGLGEGTDAADLVAAVRAHPDSSLAWALLAERALAEGTDSADAQAYAYARTGYHRGLDALRRSGWRGAGPGAVGARAQPRLPAGAVGPLRRRRPVRRGGRGGALRPVPARLLGHRVRRRSPAAEAGRPDPRTALGRGPGRRVSRCRASGPVKSERKSPSGSRLRDFTLERAQTRASRKGGDHMPGIVVVGSQWGDEGKGKATDELGDRVDFCVRYSGGQQRRSHHRRGR